MAEKQITVTIKVEGLPEFEAMLNKADRAVTALASMLIATGMSRALIDKVIADA